MKRYWSKTHERELQHIAIDNSEDIDYRDFVKIYRECIKEPSSFLATDITLPASDPLRLRKESFHTYKMTVAHQIKILDRKIKQNEAQYDLDRKSARISTLSSGNKYCWSVVEKARFECSPLKKEGLLKRLKNIDDKKEEQLKAIKNKTGIKS